MIKIRVDDFPHTKDDEKERHNINAFRDFHRCLNECIGGKRYLLGVIPKRCSVEDILMLRNETDCIIGMHGIYHNEEKLDLYKNEFPPFMSKRDVAETLMENSVALEKAIGRDVQIYMPPRNLINKMTVSLLDQCGFVGFTSGPETDSSIIESTTGYHIHSQPPHEYGRTDEMLERESHKHLMLQSDVRDVVLTLHWTWETNIGLDHMRRFFKQIPSSYFGDFE